MSEKDIRLVVSKEIWTSSSVSVIKRNNFEKLYEFYNSLDEEAVKINKALIEDEFTKYPQSVLIRFCYSVFGKHPNQDGEILKVLDEFYKAANIQWDIIEYLCNIILSFNESSYALGALAHFYDEKGMEEEKLEIWKRKIKTDPNDTETINALGDFYEKKSKVNMALHYYNIVAKHCVKENDISNLKVVWNKIIALKENASDFGEYITENAFRYAAELDKTKSVYFLGYVLECCENNFSLDEKIYLIRKILETDPHNAVYIQKIIELYREKYKDNSRTEYCLENSGLIHNYVGADIAVANFEKEIMFVENAFVQHESFGIGIIKSIEKDSIGIAFLKSGAKTMSMSMALKSLTVLPKNNIAVLKAVYSVKKQMDILTKKFLSDKQWALMTVLSSFENNSLSLDRLKSEICPSEKERQNGSIAILEEKDWNAWKKDALDILNNNPNFLMYKEDKKDICLYRKTEIKQEEKALIKFRVEKNFYSKIKCFREFLQNEDNLETDEYYTMLNYFANKTGGKDYESISSVLFLNSNDISTSKNSIESLIKNLIEKKEVIKYFDSTEDSKIRELFVEQLILVSPEGLLEYLTAIYKIWNHIFVANKIIKLFGKKEYSALLKNAVDDFKNNPEFFIYLAKNVDINEWKGAGLASYDDLLEKELELLSFLSLKLNASETAGETGLVFKKISELVFKDNIEARLKVHIKKEDVAYVKKIWSIVNNINNNELSDEKKHLSAFLKNNYKKADELFAKNETPVEKAETFPSKLLCTQALYHIKAEELKYLKEVELPANSKDIGEAKALGDLRENSEYQYAKDKRKELNARLDTLTAQIANSKVIKKEEVDANHVSFGTKVTFLNNITGKEVIYKIMGPWESDPDNGILNFQAPLGKALYNLTVNETKEFEINGEKYNLTVKQISVCDF